MTDTGLNKCFLKLKSNGTVRRMKWTSCYTFVLNFKLHLCRWGSVWGWIFRCPQTGKYQFFFFTSSASISDTCKSCLFGLAACVSIGSISDPDYHIHKSTGSPRWWTWGRRSFQSKKKENTLGPDRTVFAVQIGRGKTRPLTCIYIYIFFILFVLLYFNFKIVVVLFQQCRGSSCSSADRSHIL